MSTWCCGRSRGCKEEVSRKGAKRTQRRKDKSGEISLRLCVLFAPLREFLDPMKALEDVAHAQAQDHRATVRARGR